MKWIYVKDVPASILPVTCSHDIQEVPYQKGIEIFKIVHSYDSNQSSILEYSGKYQNKKKHVDNNNDNANTHLTI